MILPEYDFLTRIFTLFCHNFL